MYRCVYIYRYVDVYIHAYTYWVCGLGFRVGGLGADSTRDASKAAAGMVVQGG